MNKSLKIYSILLLIFLSFSAFCQNSEIDDDYKYATELLKTGDKVPNFNIQTHDGKMLDFSEFSKGNYVVLDFWASWCPDCIKDAPNVVQMCNKYSSKGVKFIGVSFDTDKEKWLLAIDKFGLSYTQVCELVSKAQSPIAKAYGVKWIPSIYLISPEGKVVVSTVLSYKIEDKLKEIFGE